MKLLIKKIQAGSLQYAIVVSILIGIILFSFTSLVFLQRKFEQKNSFFRKAQLTISYGLDYLNTNSLEYNQPQKVQFSSYDIENTIIERKPWGIFDVGLIQTTFNNESLKRSALLGYKHDEEKKSLYVSDNNQPLILVGNTRIQGDVYLPARGVKTGNISGTSYYGNTLVNGKIKQSKKELPVIKGINKISKLLRNEFPSDFKRITLHENDSIHHSFFEPTLVFQSTGRLNLGNIYLKGNIIISSNREIVVDSSAKLHDVILVAPSIRVLSNAKGNLQAIATKNIQINRNVFLEYPSSLILVDQKEENKEESIVLKENAKLYGAIIYSSNSTIYNFKPQVVFKKNTLVKGEVFCEKGLEARGNVVGTVYTNNFVVAESGGIYVNHLLDAVINRTKLPKEYLGLQLGKITELGIAKWLE